METSELLERVAQVELIAEEILADRRQIIDLDKKGHQTREAIRALKNDKQTSKPWVCFGNMFIKLPRKKVMDLLENDYSQLDEDVLDIRTKLKPKVNNLKSLENKEDLKGFGLSPLTKEELKAMDQVL